MKVISTSDIHLVELIVPVIKDLSYLSRFEQDQTLLASEDKLRSFIRRAEGGGDEISLSKVLDLVDRDPFKDLLNSTGDVINSAQGVLSSIDEAIGELTYRVEFAVIQLERPEFYRGFENFVDTPATSNLIPALREWRDLCLRKRDALTDPGLSIPEKLGAHHMAQVLLHSKAAWQLLEESFKHVAVRFFSRSNLAKGMYSKDGTIDYSIVYTLFTSGEWSDSFPSRVNAALLPFCQRDYFLTVDGVPRYIEVL